MKKLFLLMLCGLLLTSLCSCSTQQKTGQQKTKKIEADESTFIVNFNNYCEDDIYGIHFEYYLDDVAQGGGVIENAGGTVIATNDTLPKDFIPADFKASDNLNDFKIELFLKDKDGNEYSCADSIKWDAVFGDTYTINITGGYSDGFTAELSCTLLEK